MNVDENDIRLRYAELSDDGLLSVNREELIDIARECFDQELSRRGLQYEQDINVEPEAGMEPQVGSSEERASLIRGRSGGRARTMLAIGIFFSPAVDLLRVFYVGR